MKTSDLQIITQETDSINHIDCIQNAVQGGANWLQLRVKNQSLSKIELIAIQAKEICSNYNCKLIINDHIEICKKLDLDGVHLGLQDTNTAEARKFLGKDKIIGGTANSFEDVVMHFQNDVDYVGLGPFKHTDTKQNLSPILGLKGYEEILEKMKNSNIDVPIVAIGGIKESDFESLLNIGIQSFAIASLINLDINPSQKTKEILNRLQELKAKNQN
jgi:thiamine-phosphate pyrophosphorylase